MNSNSISTNMKDLTYDRISIFSYKLYYAVVRDLSSDRKSIMNFYCCEKLATDLASDKLSIQRSKTMNKYNNFFGDVIYIFLIQRLTI